MNDSVLVVAAHPDDEVLGCGGTIYRMTKEGRKVHVLIMADGESSRDTGVDNKKIEARNSAAEKASEILNCSSLKLLELPDNRMDGIELLDIIKPIENLIDEYQPSLVLTHHRGDVNIDHRLVHEAVITACRPQPGSSVGELLFFEVPSSTEWRPASDNESFNPNWFVDISSSLEFKLKALQAYKDELREYPHPRSMEAVEALSRWRGSIVGAHAAESFMLGRKILR